MVRSFSHLVLAVVLIGAAGCGGSVPSQHRLTEKVTYQPPLPGEQALMDMTKAEALEAVKTYGPEFMEEWYNAQRAKAASGGAVSQ
ncbi:MAG: hypothetical protein ACRC1K_21720 [Planctomycetia bacterium]